jgi:hypothetical protein
VSEVWWGSRGVVSIGRAHCTTALRVPKEVMPIKSEIAKYELANTDLPKY